MEKKTPLYDVHVEEGGKIVPFAGYLLPVQYGTGVLKEHMAVSSAACSTCPTWVRSCSPDPRPWTP